MDEAELKAVTSDHLLWLMGKGGQRANLSGANLRGTDLREADLRGANLRGADLSKADLRGTDLRGADWDFASFPLWCGSFGLIVDDRLAWQLVAHLTRLDTSRCSRNVRQMIRQIMPYANRFCEYRSDVGRLDLTQGGKECS